HGSHRAQPCPRRPLHDGSGPAGEAARARLSPGKRRTAGNNGGMDLDEARAVIARQHRAVLATRRADGSPQMSPVLVAVDDAGRVVISSRQPAYKVRNLRRDPRASVCVLPDGFFGPWVQVDGTAEVVDLPAAMDPLIDY